MKKVLLALCTLVLATSCIYSVNMNLGNRIVCKGDVKTEEMDLGPFSQVVVNGSADLEIVQKGSCSVKVEANEEVFQYLDYRVEDGVLILETKKDGKLVQLTANTFNVYVYVPEMESLSVNGAADAKLESYTSGKDVSVVVNGSADLELEHIQVPSLSFIINGAGDVEAKHIDVETLSISINGAGDMEISGKAGYAKMHVSGAGDIDATELDCPQIDKSKTGVASIRIRKD